MFDAYEDSADDPGDSHCIAPIRLQGDPGAAWQALQDILDEDRSFEIVASSERYIIAVATTRILRFKDDVEFLIDRAAGTISMRSASRIGDSDLGKNRSWMEDVRASLVDAGVARPAE